MKKSDKWSFIDKSHVKSIFIGKDGGFKILCPLTKREIVSKETDTTPNESRKRNEFNKSGIFKEIEHKKRMKEKDKNNLLIDSMRQIERRRSKEIKRIETVIEQELGPNDKRNLRIYNQHRKKNFIYPKLRKTFLILLKLMLNISIESEDLDLEDFEVCILEEIISRKLGKKTSKRLVKKKEKQGFK